jgi:protein arginine N-methyltransferase 1
MRLALAEHRNYLSDPIRLDAFEQAIGEIVRPGMVVCDLGAGTGILGLMACRAGAKHVYALESTPLIGLAREIAEANGFGGRISHLREFSTRADLPEPVDVILADQVGLFGFEAGTFNFFLDAVERFLRPGGALIPASVQLWAAPIEATEIWTDIEFWSRGIAGFEFRPARQVAANTEHAVILDQEQLLAEPIRLATLETGRRTTGTWVFEECFRIGRAGTLHGLGGWFVAQLSSSSAMTNGPCSDVRIKRQNACFPIEHPVSVVPGDEVAVRFQISPRDLITTWHVEVRNQQDECCQRFLQSSWNGNLLSHEDLRRLRPDWSPQLTARGRARRSVLEFCDGTNHLADIERKVFERHHDLFRDEAAAAGFVAQVVSRHIV